MSKSEGAGETAVVNSLHTLIKENDTLETVSITLHDNKNCASILHSCGEKPKIDFINITCTEDLSEPVKKHVQKFKSIHIFKSVQVFIAIPKEKEKLKKNCVIF